MILRGIDFGTVCGASGVEGFFGEGYSWHRFGKLLGLDFTGMTFVGKTVTWHAREGNMDHRLVPRCIIAKPFRREPVALNVVGLTNNGAPWYFQQGKWQARRGPFMLSFMSLAGSRGERLGELQSFVALLQQELPRFRAPIALQVNVSCPNTGHAWQDQDEMVKEAILYLDLLTTLEIPILLKVSLELDVAHAMKLHSHPALDGICTSNTIPWRHMSDRIDWDRHFGPDPVSPLAHRGFMAGGLSGAPLFPLVLEWVKAARQAGFNKAINAGGGILRPQDATDLLDVGADSVFIGSLAFLRPWRVATTIRAALAWRKSHQQVLSFSQARSSS